MLPAEKTHYRKGLALGLTLAETFSIVVFILLLACAALLRQEQTQREVASAQRDSARVDLLLTQEMVRDENMSWGNADAWFERARELDLQAEAERRRAEVAERDLARALAQVAEAARQLEDEGVPPAVVERLGEQAAAMEVLWDSLARSTTARNDAEARADSLARRAATQEDALAAMAELVEPLEEALDEREDIDEAAEQLIQRAARTQPLEDSLSLARSTISAMDREIHDSGAILDSLRGEIVDAQRQLAALGERTTRAEQERDDAIGRATFLETQLEGTGIDPPPCWLDREGDPEYLFRIEMTDRGMRLFNTAPQRRAGTDSEAMRLVAPIEEGRVYDPTTFLRLTLPFYELGVSRTVDFGPLGCRFWIRPVDLTGDRKEIFRERESQLWRRFWFRW